MEEGDGDAHYAYYALHKLRILPHELMALSRRERASIYAFIDIRIQQEKKEASRMRK